MKIKHLLLASVALVAGMASCSKDNGGDIDEGATTLFIKFDGLTNTLPNGRADAGRVQDQTTATLTTGMLFFVDGSADGNILRKVEISDYSVPGAVTPQQLSSGKLFEDIDNSAAYVYVFGNHNFQKSYYSKISEVLTETVTVTSQTNSTTWGVENANLYGRGPIVAASAATLVKAPTATKESIFEITPLIARLEMTGIHGGSGIEDFTVEDIFIHNFYEEVTPTGDLTATSPSPWVVSTNNQDYPKYHSVSNSSTPGDYLDAWSKYLYDEGVTKAANTTTKIAAPDNGAWAYNVLANAGANPHIVIKLTGVKVSATSTAPNLGAPDYYYDGTAGSGVAYLTVVGYRQSGSSVDITGGNIYEFDPLSFTDENLGETPYPGDDKEKIWVEVSVKKWTVIPVEAEFD